MARGFDASTNAKGEEFSVSSKWIDALSAPSISTASDGSFVVSWESNRDDASNYDIFAQRFYADGTLRGDEFRINRTTRNAQIRSSVDTDAEGDIVAVWQSEEQDRPGADVYAAVVDTHVVSLARVERSLAENGGIVEILATLDTPVSQDTIINLSFSGNASESLDFKMSARSILIPAQGLTGNLTLTGLPDIYQEDDETITVEVADVSNGVGIGRRQLTITLADQSHQLPFPLVVSTADDELDPVADATDLSLREAIALANNSDTADHISFAAGLPELIELGLGEVRIVDSITIHGPGTSHLTISGQEGSRIFQLG